MPSKHNEAFAELKRKLKNHTGDITEEQRKFREAILNAQAFGMNVVNTQESATGRYRVVLRRAGKFGNGSGGTNNSEQHMKITERLADGSTCERILDELDLSLPRYSAAKTEKCISSPPR